MVNVSGMKVFPNEVEDVIASMPGVLEVGVIGGFRQAEPMTRPEHTEQVHSIL